MEGGAASNVFQDGGDAVVVLDKQRAGGRPHEDLGSGTAGQALKFAQEMGILTGSTHVEGEVAIHAIGGPLHLVSEGFLGRGQRLGVGHLEHGGDTTLDRRPAPGIEIFLVFGTRLSQMHLAVDNAGQDVEPGAVDHLARLLLAEMTKADDPAA